MNENLNIFGIESEFVSLAVEEMLRKYGFTWQGGERPRLPEFYKKGLSVEFDSKRVFYNPPTISSLATNVNAKDFQEFVGKFARGEMNPIQFKVENFDVNLSLGGSVTVGCTTLKKESVDKIFTEREKLLNSPKAPTIPTIDDIIPGAKFETEGGLVKITLIQLYGGKIVFGGINNNPYVLWADSSKNGIENGFQREEALAKLVGMGAKRIN